MLASSCLLLFFLPRTRKSKISSVISENACKTEKKCVVVATRKEEKTKQREQVLLFRPLVRGGLFQKIKNHF
jgi:hypothetical protein